MKNLFSYEGKRVVIAGAGSGMGEATARVMASLGAEEIVAVDIKKPPLDDVRFLEVDLRAADAIESAVAEVARGGAIDALVYAAGLPGGSFPPVDVMLVNFIGLRHFIETAAPHMQPGAAVASVSSAAGVGFLALQAQVRPLLEIPDHAGARAWVEEKAKEDGFDPYTFSKMCTIVYTLSRGASLAPETGIRLNCVSPGPTDTPMMPHFVKQTSQEFMDRFPKPLGRNSTAEEQAWVLAFLCSEAASYVNGENVFSDGGFAGGLWTGAIDPSAMMPSGS
ncbi:MAG: SDR family oxidoreductase [Myxococcota bacterium]|nr:SDR family oxidoreductase [Myxococcota bacterium]